MYNALMKSHIASRSSVLAAFRGKRAPSRIDPSAKQTPEQIASYYQAAQIGDRAAIRQTQGGVLRFIIDEIENVKPKIGRLYLRSGSPDWGGKAFYRKTGKSCFAPTGQTSLVVPTEEVVRWAEANPQGKF
jgi:hypothetical protein